MTRRLFVSVDLPAAVAAEVAAIQAPFRGLSGVRPTDPEQSHVTLKFLGDVGERRLEMVTAELRAAVEAAGVTAFEASIDGIGVFPSFEYIRVVWLGVGEGARPMTALHDALEEGFVAKGFEPEDHDFTPHVTIARVDHAGSKTRIRELVRETDPQVGSFPIEEVRLKESTLTDDGPVYETVEAIPL